MVLVTVVTPVVIGTAVQVLVPQLVMVTMVVWMSETITVELVALTAGKLTTVWASEANATEETDNAATTDESFMVVY